MEQVIYFLNERDRRGIDIDPITGEGTEGNTVGYFIPLAPIVNNQKHFVHHLDKNLINENISNAAILLDKLICNLPSTISGNDDNNSLLITNIVRRQKLKDIEISNTKDDTMRTLYFIED